VRAIPARKLFELNLHYTFCYLNAELAAFGPPAIFREINPKDRKFYRFVNPRRTKKGRWVLVRRPNRRALCVAHVVTL